MYLKSSLLILLSLISDCQRFAPKEIQFLVQAPLPLHFQSSYDGLIPEHFKQGMLMVDRHVVGKASTAESPCASLLERFGSFILP